MRRPPSEYWTRFMSMGSGEVLGMSQLLALCLRPDSGKLSPATPAECPQTCETHSGRPEEEGPTGPEVRHRPAYGGSVIRPADLLLLPVGVPLLQELSERDRLRGRQPPINSDEAGGLNCDHHSDVFVKDWVDEVVALLKGAVERSVVVGFHRFHATSYLQSPVWMLRVLDVERHSTISQQVAVLLTRAGMRKQCSVSIPEEPHHTALRAAVGP